MLDGLRREWQHRKTSLPPIGPFLETYSAAPQVARDLFAAHFCESEVSNGGLHQFFSNPTGVLAPEAEEAFRRLGLTDAAAILAEAMSFFGHPYPREQDDRLARLQSVPGENREQWDPFFQRDEAFYATLGPDHSRFFKAMDAYAGA